MRNKIRKSLLFIIALLVFLPGCSLIDDNKEVIEDLDREILVENNSNINSRDFLDKLRDYFKKNETKENDFEEKEINNINLDKEVNKKLDEEKKTYLNKKEEAKLHNRKPLLNSKSEANKVGNLNSKDKIDLPKRKTNTSEGSTNTIEKPSKPVEKPSKPAEKPSKPVEKPSKPVEKPSKPAEKPSKPAEKPSKPVQKPSKPVEKPSKPVEKPSKPSPKPNKVKYSPNSIIVNGNSVKFNDVGYDNYNINRNQALIDQGHIISTVTKFNAFDNEITYFAGHTYAFGKTASLRVGSIVTVTDSQGNPYRYKIQGMVKQEAGETSNQSPSICGYSLVNILGGGIGVEAIGIQYCDNDDIPLIFLGFPI